ncbi:MarR family transcriptional regulator [Caulobacter hibisci]
MVSASPMSNKQYTVDAYVLDTLMRDLVGHDHRASAFLVYLALAALGDTRPRLSHAQLAERTGLSKRSVQAAVIHLAERDLIRPTRSGTTDVTRYEVLTPWRRGAEPAPGP